MNRRPGARNNRGRIATAAQSVSYTGLEPLSIVTSVTPFFYCVADLGALASQWDDQTGNARHFTAAGGAQPTKTASDATLNNRGSFTFNGTANFFTNSTWDPPAPGTTNIWFWGVPKQISWTSGDTVYGSGLSTLRCRQGTASPIVAANNTVVSSDNGGGTIGSWFRLENLFSNSVNDYLKCGATSVTGTNTGNANAAAGSFQLCADGGARFGNLAWGAIGAWAGKPTAGEISALDAWITSYYGGVVLL